MPTFSLNCCCEDTLCCNTPMVPIFATISDCGIFNGTVELSPVGPTCGCAGDSDMGHFSAVYGIGGGCPMQSLSLCLCCDSTADGCAKFQLAWAISDADNHPACLASGVAEAITCNCEPLLLVFEINIPAACGCNCGGNPMIITITE